MEVPCKSVLQNPKNDESKKKKKKHKIVINRKYNKKNINNLNIQEFMEQVKKKSLKIQTDNKCEQKNK